MSSSELKEVQTFIRELHKGWKGETGRKTFQHDYTRIMLALERYDNILEKHINGKSSSENSMGEPVS